jgi:hypothetical protein
MKVTLNVGLKVRPLLKVQLRAQNAGELCANLGANPEVAIAQKGFENNIFERVTVYASDENGNYIDHAAFGVTEADDGQLVTVDNDDTISMIQRTDAGAAHGLSLQYAQWLAAGLHPVVRFHYRADIAANPALRAKYNAEYGLVERDPMQLAPGYDQQTRRLVPAKDRGCYFEYGRGRKTTR